MKRSCMWLVSAGVVYPLILFFLLSGVACQSRQSQPARPTPEATVDAEMQLISLPNTSARLTLPRSWKVTQESDDSLLITQSHSIVAYYVNQAGVAEKAVVFAVFPIAANDLLSALSREDAPTSQIVAVETKHVGDVTVIAGIDKTAIGVDEKFYIIQLENNTLLVHYSESSIATELVEDIIKRIVIPSRKP